HTLGNFKGKELLAKHNITHILSIHDTAAPILEGRPHLSLKLSYPHFQLLYGK
uniref:Uncharacterized protein n=1 Tax=Hucho hucho TaxID=62062 RepID=A0A4W5QQV1_9TELE